MGTYLDNPTLQSLRREVSRICDRRRINSWDWVYIDTKAIDRFRRGESVIEILTWAREFTTDLRRAIDENTRGQRAAELINPES